jgi:Predicted membrane protein (DUF2232)
MQAVAAWLVARPQNAVLALAATISLAYLSILSGVVLVLLVLHKGPKRTVVDVALASGLLALVGFIAQVPLVTVLSGAVVMWLPAMLLGVLLLTTRSLTLTVQFSVIMAILAMLGFYLLVDDPVGFWRSILTTVVDVWRELGLTEQADLLDGQMDAIAGQMTTVAVLMSWAVYSVNLVLGYLLYRRLPGETADFGRFRDLNLGRVVAINMALASVIALLSGAIWLQNIAFVMFFVFWLQGLAIVHWMHGEGHLPVFGVIAVYALMPFLSVILLMALAVTGYIDTWFRLRRPGTA